MESINQSQEPQFEGEVMKIPGSDKATTAPNASPITTQGPHFGLIIGLLFLTLALILVGLYLWSRLMTQTDIVISIPGRPTTEMNQEPESTTSRAQAEASMVLSTSNELSAIEADLLSTDLTTLINELTVIDNELGSLPATP